MVDAGNLHLDAKTHPSGGLVINMTYREDECYYTSRLADSSVFLVPYGMMADSLQRLIFFRTAIRSAHGATICLEEPEAHTFPPYISMVVKDIIDARDNQFFITTQSPYVVSEFLESCFDDLSIYIVDAIGGNTVARHLSDEDKQTVLDDGIDMFFNINFID